MRGTKAKRLRREARAAFPFAKGAENVVQQGHMQFVPSYALGGLGSIHGVARHLGKDNIKKIYRMVKKLQGNK